LPTSTSAVISSMRFLACAALSASVEAIVIVPSSPMSIVQPVSSVERADGRAALADDVADLLRVDLHGVQARRELRHLLLGAAHRFLHLAEDVQARFLGLRQGDLHDSPW
jgi:hypothetical protein